MILARNLKLLWCHLLILLVPRIGDDDGLEAIGRHCFGAHAVSTTILDVLVAIHIIAININLWMFHRSMRLRR